MYPRARGKGGTQGAGHGDGDAVPGAARTMAAPLACDAASSSTTTVGHREPVHSLSSSTASHHPSAGSGNRKSVHASQQQQSPPPMPHIQSGIYGEAMQDAGASSPTAPPPPHFYAGNVHHHGGSLGGSAHRSTTSSSYDQQKQPLPRPSPLHMNGHQGDWLAGASSSPTMSAVVQRGFPAGMTTASATGQVSFSPHSRTNSSAVVTPSIGIAATSSSMPAPTMSGAAPGSADYRPPAVYGEVNLGSSIGAGASVTHSSSLTSLNRTNASLSGSLVNTVNATRRSPRMAASMAGASVGINTPVGAAAPPPPSNMGAGAPIVQVGMTGSSCPAAAPVRADVPGVTSLKITVGGCTSVIAASAPLSPLMNSPLLARQQPHSQARQPRSAERSKRPLHATSDARKGGVDNIDVESDEDRSRSPGMGPTKPTVEQAEARYRYLHDEFRKVSRLRAKLVEENECMKREQTALREALDLYRRKIVSAAAERKTLLADYLEDVHNALRLAQELAADVAAVHSSGDGASRPALASNGGVHSIPVASAQQTLDAAISRVLASNASIAAAAPPTVPPSGIPVPLAPPQGAAGFSGSPLLSIGEQLGLRYGRWMVMRAAAPCFPMMGEEASYPDLSEGHRRSTGPWCQQGVLLRDEIRDVYCNTHAAISAYMTSLDYGFAPMFSQGSYPPAGCQGQCHLQQQLSSEYHGLRFHVDIPRFHAHTVSSVSDAANAGGDCTGGQNTPVHSASSQPPLLQEPPSPYLAPQNPRMTPALT
ncbi:hypothetical protein LMJF_19_0600 [Leishmania major strain Friedlin]|uniref:Uncharacterized protein n=1 Tax=Leishmania major TaxID=5664 RepID=Q4QDG1_LEIMA|nr:hypothetical protein LMJF_19_0600 [Leishmania major strain Friedlin]CAG9572747.1 hypothetical_protein_-_conserved [Leishmania major strain Friedlin]CAJ07145.1 hypothetical protein LMJF_19_0600 [Leishmania major strain Friedlin]|eukprot:XP_001682637.1 hypothetical protein LMJF_19_0600 [Leishmania major strain Friedlin]